MFPFVYFRPEDRSNHCLYRLHRAKPSAASTAATVLLPYACRSLAPRCPQGSPPCSTLWRSAILNSQYLNVIRTSSPSAQELRESCGECIHNLWILLPCCTQGSWSNLCLTLELSRSFIIISFTHANNSHIETVKYSVNRNFSFLILINIKNFTY